MGQEPEEAECAVAAKLVFFIEWKTVASGPGRAAGCVELVEVIGAIEDYLERCAGIEALDRLMEPEDEEVCLRDILKCSTRGNSNVFQLFDTKEKKNHFVASGRRLLERYLQTSGQNEWHNILSIKE